MLNRRAFIKAAPVAVGVACAAPGAAKTLSEPMVHGEAMIAPAVREWQWWGSGHDGEYRAGPFSTREEAILATPPGETIIEAVQGELDLSIDVDRIFEDWNENSDNQNSDGDFCLSDRVSDADYKDLQKRLDRAVTEWVVANKIDTTGWRFDDTRNEESPDFYGPDTDLLWRARAAGNLDAVAILNWPVEGHAA